MVSKLIIKARVFLDANFQVPSSKQYQVIQTFEFYRFYKPLGESIAPGCPWRTEHDLGRLSDGSYQRQSQLRNL